MHYMFRYFEKKCEFSAALNLSSLSIGLQRSSGREFQAIELATEHPTTKLAVTMLMSWNDKLVAAGRAKMLMAVNIRSRCASVHQVLWRPALKTLVDSHSNLLLDTFRNVEQVQLSDKQ